MRAISLWQPWAELIARGLKEYETRSFPCQLGTVVIQAAKKKFNSADYGQDLRTQMLMDEVDPFFLKYGAVLCIADIIGCQKTETLREQISKRECTYGDWSDGRYAWRFGNVRRLPEPVELKGHQGWFFWKEAKDVLAGMGMEVRGA